jgi:Sulfotransferase family
MTGATFHSRPHRALQIRLLNTIGRVSRRLGFAGPSLEEGSLIDAARAETGLDDFGSERFRNGLRMLLECLESEARLSPVGRTAARREITGYLANRLRVLDHRKCHPELAAEEIRRPLFVVGLPRTGTTFLFDLLAQDPAFRSPLSWELFAPCPPPEIGTYDCDPRIAQAEERFDALKSFVPGFEAIHPVGAKLPEECLIIHALDFHSLLFEAAYNVPSYERWLELQDMRPTYRFQRDFLQHLQSRCPAPRWLLKSPAHLLALDALLEVFPDAIIVQTHRSPLEVMGSVASLHCALRGAMSDSIDPCAVGRDQLELWSRVLPRAIAMRDRDPGEANRFFDVRYDDLVSAPLECVQRIYAHFEMEFTPQAQTRMNEFLARDARSGRGVHRYSLEMFGIDSAEASRRFAGYCERFAIRSSAQAK